MAAAISPDGRFLAYSDDGAVYLKIIETGETHALRALQGYRLSYLSWFPDGSKLLVSSVDAQRGSEGIWALSIVDPLFRKLTGHAGEAAASQDGSRVAYIGENGKEVWVGRTGEPNPHRIYLGEDGDRLGDLAWIAAGEMLLFRRLHIGEYQFEVRMECRRWTGRELREPRETAAFMRSAMPEVRSSMN